MSRQWQSAWNKAPIRAASRDSKRRLEGREPVFGGTPGLLRGLKLKEGLIEIVHLGLLRATSPRRTPLAELWTGNSLGVHAGAPARGVHGCPTLRHIPSKR